MRKDASRQSAAAARHAQQGVSTIELMLVMAIVAVVSVIAIPRYSASNARYRADLTAQRLSHDLEYASVLARTSNQPLEVEFGAIAAAAGDVGVGYRFVGIEDPDHVASEYIVRLDDEPYHARFASAPETLTFNVEGLPETEGVFVVATGASTWRTVTIASDSGEVEIE